MTYRLGQMWFVINRPITISKDVKSARWRLFGHVLRMPRDTPAQQAIDYYFADTGDATFRGRPWTSLPNALSADLRRLGRTLRRPADNDAFGLLNREQWRQLERDIAEESWTNWYKHLTYFDITDKSASVLTMFWANGLLNYLFVYFN